MCLSSAPLRAAEPSPQPGSVYDQANQRFRTGSGLASRKDFAGAAPEFQAAVRLNPKFGAAYYWLGICDFMRNDSVAAIGDFKSALVNTRDTNLLALIHYDLGIQYLKTGDRASADAEYRSAVLLNPALARHPMTPQPPAPAAAPPPPSAAPAVPPPAPRSAAEPATLRLVWIFAVAILILVIAVPLTAARIARTTGRVDPAPGTAAIAGRDEIVRLTGAWTPEPELTTTPVPRPIEFVGSKRLILFAAAAAVGLAIALRPFALVERWVILNQGEPGTATVQGKYQTTHRSKHGHFFLQHLTLGYTPPSDHSRTADAVVGDSSSLALGQTLPIHFLSGHPDWAVLDDDLGYSSKQERAALISGAFVGLAFGLGLILSLPGLRKERALLRTGQPRGAYVESVAAGSKGYAAAVLSYEIMGQLHHVRSLVATQNLDKPLQTGQVLTVLVDPSAPESFAVYKASSFRVAPM
jgi:tetratricopeptide (TPR) repeat protein